MNQPKRTRKEIRGAVIGMVLGDGAMYQNKFRDGSFKGNFKLDIAHSIKQQDYLNHKRDIVQPWFHYELPVKNRVCSVRGKQYPAVRLQTRVNSRFKIIAKNLFVGRVKRITQWALSNITLEGLALWWMDDGCVWLDKRNNHGGGRVIWGTYGYPKNDVILFKEWLKSNFNIDLQIKKHKKSGYFLYRGLSEGRKLLDLISDYAVDSMKYKFEWQNAFTRTPYSLKSTIINTAPTPCNLQGDDIVRAL